MNVYIWTSGELKNAYIGEVWTPWANTLAYYPLTATTTTNDMKGSWTLYNLENYNNVAFWTYAGVSCASFTWNNMILYYTEFPARWTWDTTMSCWMYTTSNNQQYVMTYWFEASTALVMQIRNWYIDPNIAPVSLNNWHNIVYSVTNSNLKMYVDGTQVYNASYPVSMTKSIWLWRQTFTETNNYLWYLSEVIIESKWWTQSEVTSYYNSTKANYWIS